MMNLSTIQKRATLKKRLDLICKALLVIETGWPHRPPDDKQHEPKVVALDKRIPEKYLTAVRVEAQRVVNALPGWDVMVHVNRWTGRDPGAMITIFMNGCSSHQSQFVRFFSHDIPGVVTAAQCLKACVSAFPETVTGLIARFQKYPLDVFTSKRYLRLCELRRKLNARYYENT